MALSEWWASFRRRYEDWLFVLRYDERERQNQKGIEDLLEPGLRKIFMHRSVSSHYAKSLEEPLRNIFTMEQARLEKEREKQEDMRILDVAQQERTGIAIADFGLVQKPVTSTEKGERWIAELVQKPTREG